MNQKPPQDYSLEKLSKTDGFKIYPPVNADFRFETLDADSLPDLPNYVDDNDYDPHPNPSGLHMFPGDFDNDPNTPMDTILIDKKTRKYRINGSPKKKKKRKSFNFDFPPEKELKKYSNPSMYGVPQPYHGKSQIIVFPRNIPETSHFRTPDEALPPFLYNINSPQPQPLNKGIRLGKFKSEIDNDVTNRDSIITNNSLVPNFNKYDRNPNRPMQPNIPEEGFNWDWNMSRRNMYGNFNDGEIAQTVSVPKPYSTNRTFQHSQPQNEGLDWKSRESLNNIISKHNHSKF
jgi:hypothetical protein